MGKKIAPASRKTHLLVLMQTTTWVNHARKTHAARRMPPILSMVYS